MKNIFTKPVMTVNAFEAENILTGSGVITGNVDGVEFSSLTIDGEYAGVSTSWNTTGNTLTLNSLF